jgi:hypothetical protein
LIDSVVLAQQNEGHECESDVDSDRVAATRMFNENLHSHTTAARRRILLMCLNQNEC